MVYIEEYLKKELDQETEQKLKDFAKYVQKEKGENSLSFLFATDLHYKSDNELTFGTIKRLREMVKFAELIKPDFFVLNGDLTDGHSEKSKILSELSEILDKLTKMPIIINKGNHDSATWFAYENKSSEYLKNHEWNMIISKFTGRKEEGYGYLDFEKQKIRAIYLNTSDIKDETDELGRITTDACQQWRLGIGDKQVAWLENVLSSCPEDYFLIFFSHNVPCDSLNQKSRLCNGERVWNIIRDADKTNKVLAYMYGHRHRDSKDVIDGISCICTKDMQNASVRTDDGTEYCATLKDIPVICSEPVLNNDKAQILGGWDYVEIDRKSFKSRRFLLPNGSRDIIL